MKCYEIRFDNDAVMFVRDEALALNIKHALRLAGTRCRVNVADIGDEIISPIRKDEPCEKMPMEMEDCEPKRNRTERDW